MLRAILAVVGWLLGFHLSAQTYVNQAYALNIFHQLDTGENGAGLSIVDINNDGWEDITFCNSNAMPSIYLNGENGFVLMQPFDQFDEEIKQCNWVDYDNDGWKDLVFTSLRGPMRIYRNLGNLTFQDVTQLTGLSFDGYETYGNAWADYDRDGDLDVYIANYNGEAFGDPNIENFLYQNNGNGTFSDVTEYAGVGDGATYSFLGVWMYYDDDLWPDLFVSNDRFESANSLYKNNGDGTFSNVSEQADIDYNILSMGVAVDDFDNDGDDDLYVSNWTNNLHLRNDNGLFVNMADSFDTDVDRFSWGAIFFDANNDGKKDIYVATAPHIQTVGQDQILLNNDTSFVTISDNAGLENENSITYGAACGDLNNDGFVDIATINRSPGFAKVWIANPTNANWLKVQLKGNLSNRDGIGARIICYSALGAQYQVVRCGESYLSQHSLIEHFGLDSVQTVDSVVVYWPSGVRDVWKRIPTNQTLLLIEQGGFEATLAGEEYIIKCTSDTLQLQLACTLCSLEQWSTGNAQDTLLIAEAGTIWATVSDTLGNRFYTNQIWIENYPTLPLAYSVSQPICADDMAIVLLTNPDVNELYWIDDQQGVNGAWILTSGYHEIVRVDSFACSVSETISILWLQPIVGNVTKSDLTCYGAADGAISIDLTGGQPPYEWIVGNDWMPNLDSGSYFFQVTDALGCAWQSQIMIVEPEQLLADITVSAPLCAEDGFGQVEWNIEGGIQPYWISDTWASDLAVPIGDHSLSVSDANGCEVNISFEMPATVPISCTLVVQDAIENAANGLVNCFVTGGTEPYSYWWSSGSGNQPFADNLPLGEYMLQVIDSNGCSWDSLFSVLSVSSVLATKQLPILFGPQPANDRILFNQMIYAAALYDISGRIVKSFDQIISELDVSDVPRGLYFLSAKDNAERWHNLRFIVE
jgi:ASPIC and UnbV/FG-GAP-like repeat/SprB repeat